MSVTPAFFHDDQLVPYSGNAIERPIGLKVCPMPLNAIVFTLPRWVLQFRHDSTQSFRHVS